MERLDKTNLVRQLISEPPTLPIHYRPHPPAPQVFGQTDHSNTTALANGGARAGIWYALHLRALALALVSAGDHLIAPPLLSGRVAPHPYQISVVHHVLHEMRPAAILADEVGLGKTIEAGLILKELILRAEASTVLVVAPKALLPQWQEELRVRFDEDFALAEERRFRGYEHEDRIICSFQQFTRAFERIHTRIWDCLIVDEAHLLANPDAKRRRCMSELRTHWRLLLTATPIQNKITDLYSLIDLVRPGRLGTLRQFVAEYAADPTTCRAVAPAKAGELRATAHEVMCRTRREETGITFAPRDVRTHRVQAEAKEDAINHEVTAYLRALYRHGIVTDAAPTDISRHKPQPAGATALNRGALIREIIALQQSLSSSPRAIAASLRARAQRHRDEQQVLLELAERCEQTSSAKERLLCDALVTQNEPVLIFTLRLETARHLRDVIMATGRRAECYVGELTGDQRRTLVARFNHGEIGALIATDAGAEGLNLQERCHTIYNYDLHWNPMKMEQRIGRVHRFGQTHPVTVANFALAQSIDDYVLRLLYEKMELFTMTIGALESVLANEAEGDLDLEQRILDVWLRDEDQQAAEKRVDALGDKLLESLRDMRLAETLTKEILG